MSSALTDRIFKRFNRKRIVVMGLGRFGGGMGAVKFFADAGADILLTDLKDKESLAGSLAEISNLKIETTLGAHVEKDFKTADIVCISPAVRPGNPFLKAAREAGAVICTEIGLFFEYFPGRIIGITGSNGKSTTTQLVYEMLKGHNNISLGGNIGISLLPRITSFSSDDSAVLELSSFQLKRLKHLKRSPDTAVITNITPNHLDWHTDFNDYQDSKSIITAFQKTEDVVIYNSESSGAVEAAQRSSGEKIAFGKGGGIYLEKEDAVLKQGDTCFSLFKISDVRIPGRFNLINCCLASGAAFQNGAQPSEIRRAIQNFSGLHHRLELVGEYDCIKYYNDSVSTTPESTAAAAEALAGNSIFILGGYDKGISLVPAAEAVSRYCRGAICIGKTGPALLKLLKARGTWAQSADDLNEAVDKAFRKVKEAGPGSIILSPACASYDMFVNFEDRGEKFKETVEELKERSKHGA